jgi:hypothetical protein
VQEHFLTILETTQRHKDVFPDAFVPEVKTLRSCRTFGKALIVNYSRLVTLSEIGPREYLRDQEQLLYLYL